MYTSETGTAVKLAIVDTGNTLIRAVLAGKGPDAAIMIGMSSPINLAMRGALIDLKSLGLSDEFMNEFLPSAWTPFEYQGGIYAVPESQSYDMLFYSIIKQLNEEGANSLSIRYIGWNNSGVSNLKITNSAKASSKLGGKKELKGVCGSVIFSYLKNIEGIAEKGIVKKSFCHNGILRLYFFKKRDESRKYLYLLFDRFYIRIKNKTPRSITLRGSLVYLL